MKKIKMFSVSFIILCNSVPQKDENVVLDREPPLGSDVLLEENKQSVSEELKSQIRNLGQQYGYDMFENVLLDGVNVPVVLATDSVALLLNPLTKKREWIADEDSVEEDIEPTWFSAEGLITSPFYQMCKAAEQLKQQEPESDIVPIVLLCEGSILNAGALIEQWHSKDAFVALLNNGKAEGLPHLEEVLALKNSSVSA